MADNVTFTNDPAKLATPPTATVVAADDVGGVVYQIVKLDAGGDGASVPVTGTTGLPVKVIPAARTAAAPTAASVGLASGVALAANGDRKGLLLVNTSANIISIAFGVDAVLYSGITLYALGGSYEMTDSELATGSVNAIASGAASNLAIQEYS